MRELKFRAWDTISGEWVETVNIRGESRREFNIYSFPITPFEIRNNLIIEQYTGLKDKSGKEIYEGDIVSYLKSNYEIYFDKVQGWRGIRRGGSHSIIPNGETVYNMTINQVGKPEVIGNIHENPELCGEEKE